MTTLTQDQQNNARIIIARAYANFPAALAQQAAVVAIATALQESGLNNLDHGDRDSVGLFQQRASWGSKAERMDPATAADKFYAHLKKVAGWPVLPVTQAAQAVQISAYPNAYAKHENDARTIVAQFAPGGNAPVQGDGTTPNNAGSNNPFALLGTPAFWQRSGLVALGAVMVILALVFTLKSTPVASAAKSAAQFIPKGTPNA